MNMDMRKRGDQVENKNMRELEKSNILNKNSKKRNVLK